MTGDGVDSDRTTHSILWYNVVYIYSTTLHVHPGPVDCVLLVSQRLVPSDMGILFICFALVTTRTASVLQPATPTATIIQAHQIEHPQHRCLGATTPSRS